MDDLQAHHNGGSDIELPEPSFECSQESTGTQATACQSTDYASLIYITGQRCFWLLTTDALKAINESSDRLSSIIQAEDSKSRYEGLRSVGISDLFVPAHPRTFLPRTLQDEWRSLEREEKRLEAEFADRTASFEALNDEYRDLFQEVRNTANAPAATRSRFSDVANERHREKVATPQKLRELRYQITTGANRIAELRGMGFTAAEKAGFIVQDDTLYSPHQQKIARLLREYKEAKSAFLGHELPDEAKYHSFVRLCRGHNRSVACQLEPSHENLEQIEQFLEEYHGQFSYIGPYLEKAIELASNGVAVAEYVLANHGDIRSGLDRLSEYHQMERDYRQVESELEKAVSDWAKVLGRNGPIPQTEIDQYRKKMDEHRARMHRFRNKTEALAKNLEPLRLFVWDPEDFAAEPYRVLIKPGMPLREFTQIGNDDLVKHFSLTDLPGIKRHVDANHLLPAHDVYGQETAEQVALSLKKAQSIGQDDVLDKVLEGLGCIKLTLDGAWFNDRGLFLPNQFYRQVQQEYTVPALKPEDDRNAWGPHLRSLIFESDARKHLMLFDDSYMAQFSRFVLNGVDRDVADYVRKNVKVTAQMSASGPASGADASQQFIVDGKKANTTKISYDLAKVSIGGKLMLMQGDLNLLDIRLPEPENAKPVPISYRTEVGEGEMDVGRFYCKLNAKLTGYVGANVLLSGGLGVEIEKGKGLTLAGVRDGAPEGHVGGFAGAQAGVLASTSLYWNLPDDARARVDYMRAHDPVAEWVCVGKLHAGLTGSWGVGFSRSFQLGMHNGRLVFSGDAGLTTGLGLNGKLAFEIDFNAVPYWMAIVQNELHKNDYRHMEWISPDAFGYLSQLSYLFMATALDISFLASRPWSFVQQVFDSINSSERAGMVALRIERVARDVSNGRNLETARAFQDWFKGLQPEAIGPLLHNLVSEPVEYKVKNESQLNSPDGSEAKSAEEMLRAQQVSIFQCLKWMSEGESELVMAGSRPHPCQRQFEESLIRMNVHGEKPGDDLTMLLANNVSRLDDFMGRDLTLPLYEDRFTNYLRLRENLVSHLKEQA